MAEQQPQIEAERRLKDAQASMNMESMWKEAEKKFKEISGTELVPEDVNNLEHVRKEIEKSCDAAAAASSSDQDGKKWDKAKKAGLQVLKGLSFLIETAAEASSVIPFPPAATSLTKSALCLVFAIPQKVKDYNDLIDKIFSEIAPTLSQFEIYRSMENVDRSLCIQIHLVLDSFVTICAHVVKHRHSGKKDRFINFVRGAPSELNEELSTFAKLLQAQRDVEGTLTFAKVTDIEKRAETIQKGVQEAQKDLRSLGSDANRAKSLALIRDTFNLSETVSFDATTSQTCTDIAGKCAEKTGAWIWDHEAYRSWISSKGDPVLVVSGPPSSGKTSIARVDPTLQKTLAKACETPGSFRSSAESELSKLWEEMKIGQSGSTATYYFVLDGIENLIEKDAKTLLTFVFGFQRDQQPGKAVRLLLSGTANLFAEHQDRDGEREIRMDIENPQDMRIIIQRKLSRHGMLQNAKPNVQEQTAKDMILEDLPGKSKGSYSSLELELNKVIKQFSRRTAIEDLEKMLKSPTNSRGEAIRDLERALTADDIAELNELLKWVVYGTVSLTIDELEAAMALSSGFAYVPWLESAIKTKYSTILKLEDGLVCTQDEVEEYFREIGTASKLSVTTEDQSSISMTVSIRNASREQCGQFFWTLADRAFRDKFQFPFEGESLNSFHSLGQRISVDEFEAHYFIATHAFQYFANAPVDATKAIGNYLLNWLPHHLDTLRELEDTKKGELTSAQKVEIGLGLYKMFKDDSVVQSHKESFQKCFWTSDEFKNVRLWMDDPVVVRDMDRTWRAEVKQASDPTKGYLKHLVTAVLQGFLVDRTWDIANACEWLRHFMDLDTAGGDGNPTSSLSQSFQMSRSRMNWDNVNKWCQSFLGKGDSDVDSLWYERLAEATLQDEDWDLTSSFYDRALRKENPSWLCYRGLAMSYYAQGRTGDAIDKLKQALDEASKEVAAPQPKPTDLATLHLLLGRYCHEAGDTQQATSHFLQAGETGDPEQLTQAVLGQLKAALAVADPGKTMQVLKSIFEGKDAEKTPSGVLKMIAQDPDHELLVMGMCNVARADSKLLGRILAVMKTITSTPAQVQDRSVETLDQDEQYLDKQTRGVLLYDRGAAILQFGEALGLGSTDDNALIDEAVQLWTESEEQLREAGGSVAFTVRRSAISALAKHYFHEMVDRGLNSAQMDILAKLAKDGSVFYSDPCSGYLAILYARNGKDDEARQALRPQVEVAIRILSDDWPENDFLGFAILQSTLAQYSDLENSVVAMSLQGQPDLVASALRFGPTDVDQTEDNQELLELARNLANETISEARKKVPDASKQFLRIQAAKSHVASIDPLEYLSSDVGISSDEHIPNEERTSKYGVHIFEGVHSLIRDRLNALAERHCSEMDDRLLVKISCDGKGIDGKKCDKVADFKDNFYHCTYCFNCDLCSDCLKQMRDSNSKATPVCSPSHKWIRCPPQGDDFYVGPEAENVRLPNSVDTLPGDEKHIFVANFGNGESQQISVEAWKKQLTDQWGIIPDE